MARYPKIDSPCPYKADLAAVMDGDFCRMCKRSVIDLDAMSDGDRTLFLSACQDEVCVSYTFRPALAAAALAAATLVPTAAAAQDTPPVDPSAIAQPVDEPEYEDIAIIVGGIKDPKNAKFVDNPVDAMLPAIPVVYDDEDAPVPIAKKATPDRRRQIGDD